MEFHKSRVHCLALQCERLCGGNRVGWKSGRNLWTFRIVVCIIALHCNVEGLCWGEVGVSVGGLGFAEGGRVGGICGFS